MRLLDKFCLMYALGCRLSDSAICPAKLSAVINIYLSVLEHTWVGTDLAYRDDYFPLILHIWPFLSSWLWRTWTGHSMWTIAFMALLWKSFVAMSAFYCMQNWKRMKHSWSESEKRGWIRIRAIKEVSSQISKIPQIVLYFGPWLANDVGFQIEFRNLEKKTQMLDCAFFFIDEIPPYNFHWDLLQLK